ncbi:MAG: GNAT family N-acetyltransferase [Candidatus Parabeggiatoa sp.]|nr:GNAT family N-acetyltransferase [Candidatus Parabeggiatoa sp.]
MTFSIVKAEIQDVEKLAPLFEGYRHFYKQEHNLEGAQKFLRERLSQNESVIFIAKESDNNDFLGFVQLYPSFISVRMQRLWILNDLFVAEKSRKKGVASALMKAAENFAKEEGASRLVLQTTSDNRIAQRLYEAIGYQKDPNIRYVLNLS